MSDDKETLNVEQEQEELLQEPLIEQIKGLNARMTANVEWLARMPPIQIDLSSLTTTLEIVQQSLRSLSRHERLLTYSAERATKILADSTTQLDQLVKQFQHSSMAISQLNLSPLAEASRNLELTLRRYEALLNKSLADHLRTLYEAAERLRPDFSRILERFSRTQARNLERTLTRYRWWPVPGLPFEFYQGVVTLIEQGQTRRVNRYICDWFRWNRYRRLGRMVRRWDQNKYFRRRRAIYGQALKAHRRGWYNLSVPALIPLVEGIARDYLHEEHGVTVRKGLKAIKEALNRNVPEDVFLEELQQALIRFLTSSTFADTNDVLPSGYELNRHGVAHGRYARYGTEANSLRCFLLLETLYQYICEDPDDSWH